MCGFAGYWGGGRIEASIGTRMASRIESRGPDDAGVWVDKAAGIVLAHRRLAILDLSPAGHQPFRSPCGRYTLVYNGEIYNHNELRGDLESEGGSFLWRGHSDTETLLTALRHWGTEGALERLNGMFAFALWDARERLLVLARDRMGEKPLYYGRNRDLFLFGSEIKALTSHPQWQGRVNLDALALYLRHSYVPAPWSIYQGIFKLPPAHFVTIQEGGCSVGKPVCYWDLSAIAQSGATRASGTSEEQVDVLNELLRDCVGKRMVADVPVGAFLSGGYDSTAVVALMQEQSCRPVKTFSIGFHEEIYNEAPYAKAVAEHLGTDHTELYVTPGEAMAVIPRLPEIYNEPFSDASQIPTFLISRLAGRHVKVSLSGDGGDELFCGYNRYVFGYELWQKLRLLPPGLRRILGRTLSRIPVRQLNIFQACLPRRMRVTKIEDRLPKLIEVMSRSDRDSFYCALVSHWKNPEAIVRGAHELATVLGRSERVPDFPDFRERMMFLDMITYLPDDILTKVDRASMAVSLEVRVPLLDHRLVEFAWSVPTDLKYRRGEGKWLLRQVIYRYVPKQLMDRPKMGFGVPLEHWLRGPLRDWAEDLLDERKLKEEGFFDPEPIKKLWSEHLSGKRRWHYYLWDVLMFQAWLKEANSK